MIRVPSIGQASTILTKLILRLLTRSLMKLQRNMISLWPSKKNPKKLYQGRRLSPGLPKKNLMDIAISMSIKLLILLSKLVAPKLAMKRLRLNFRQKNTLSHKE